MGRGRVNDACSPFCTECLLTLRQRIRPEGVVEGIVGIEELRARGVDGTKAGRYLIENLRYG